jgi:hypothetical protein
VSGPQPRPAARKRQRQVAATVSRRADLLADELAALASLSDTWALPVPAAIHRAGSDLKAWAGVLRRVAGGGG